jgi:hypothetical protein
VRVKRVVRPAFDGASSAASDICVRLYAVDAMISSSRVRRGALPPERSLHPAVDPLVGSVERTSWQRPRVAGSGTDRTLRRRARWTLFVI